MQLRGVSQGDMHDFHEKQGEYPAEQDGGNRERALKNGEYDGEYIPQIYINLI